MAISIYLIIALICAILLIVTVALGGLTGDVDVGGGDFDVAGPDFDVAGPDIDVGGADIGYGDFTGPGISPLSLPVVLAFGTTFGGIGAVLEQIGMDVFIIPVIAIFVSIAVAGGMYMLVVKVFVKTQTSSMVDMQALIGEDGTVTVAIKPGMTGQVLVVTEARGRTLLAAVADEGIPTDTTVRVTGIVGNGVRVERK